MESRAGLPERLGRYQVLGVLGSGGMGDVLKARDPQLGREVAIKLISAQATGPSFRERFRREAQTLAGLTHPNLVRIYDFGEHEGQLYIVTELLQGETLRERLKRGPLREAEAQRTAREAASAMQAAHDAGIVHRDLKPENLFLRDDGTLVVIDFGLARPVDAAPLGATAEQDPETLVAVTNPGSVLGTLGYLSPEQARGQVVSKASDVFSLGCVLYETLTGERAFAGDSHSALIAAVLEQTPAQLEAMRGSKLGAVIAGCLDKDPHQRYEDGGALLAALTDTDSSEFPVTRSPGIAALAAGLAIAVAAIGWVLFVRIAKDRERERLLPEIEAAIENHDYWEAHALLEEATGHFEEAQLERLWADATFEVDWSPEPAGATVSIKPYGAPDSQFRFLGEMPFKARIPTGVSVFRVEKEGFHTWNWAAKPNEFVYRGNVLLPLGSLPEGTVFAGTGGHVTLYGVENEYRTHAPSAVDEVEVTNLAYQAFHQSSDFDDPTLWPTAFVGDDWPEPLEAFLDATGRPGPASWELGEPVEGLLNHPVSGVSWYEAYAFCRWRNQSLPTLYHWSSAASPKHARNEQVALSNYSGTGTREVRARENIGVTGAYDMAGNVREWVLNSRDGERFILGGSYKDPGYSFVLAQTLPPDDRSLENGLRCLTTLDPSEIPQLGGEITSRPRQLESVDETPQELLDVYRGLVSTPPQDAQVIATRTNEDAEHWRWETVEIEETQGRSFEVELFFPTSEPPEGGFPAAVVFPGNAAFWDSGTAPSSRLFLAAFNAPGFEFLPRADWVAVLPVFRSLYQSEPKELTFPLREARTTFDHIVSWNRQISRALDLVESDARINADRTAFLGYSFGGAFTSMVIPFENRFSSVVVWNGGIPTHWSFMVDDPERSTPFALAPALDLALARYIEAPFLMINGGDDLVFPLDLSQRPLFENVGTPDDQKKHIVFEGMSHWLPHARTIGETLAWFERWD